jgi:hypothetical protein
METAWNWLAWLAYGLAWAPIVWFLVACAIGIPWLIRDEIRLKRTAPKPAEVAAYADRMEAAHGRAGLTVVGKAMYDARTNGDFQKHRFLKEVSGELVQRLVDRHSAGTP